MDAKAKIFIVDDDESFLRETKALLEEGGYPCMTCSDSTKALSAIESFTPDCVILDINMPFLDGQDLLLLIRRRYPDLPVIVCTAIPNVDERYLLKSGASDILRKPFDHTVLFNTLDEAISKKDEVTPMVLRGFNLRENQNTVLRKTIVRALSHTNFNHTHSAALLGISRQCLLRYIKRLHIAC